MSAFNPKQLIILDNNENDAYFVYNDLLDKYPGLDIVLLIANIRDREKLEAIFQKYKPDVVFHAAAHKHVPLMEYNPDEAVKNNVLGTMNVAECSDKTGVGRFVLISTDKAVNPSSVMGATKRIAEMIIQAINQCSKTEFVAVRFGNVLGSSGSVVPLFRKQIEDGGPVKVTHPEVSRFFMTVTEAVQLVIEAAVIAKGGEIFVLDMGEPVRIYDLARNLIRLSGLRPEIDIKIEFTGLRPGEKLHEELVLAEESVRSTENNKIFVVEPVFISYEELKNKIREFNNININNKEKVIEFIEAIVPLCKNQQMYI
ncbi:MAG: UDP-N-acetylglucosamine 4,6-dehydratase family protein [Acetivibrionales bacterium]